MDDTKAAAPSEALGEDLGEAFEGVVTVFDSEALEDEVTEEVTAFFFGMKPRPSDSLAWLKAATDGLRDSPLRDGRDFRGREATILLAVFKFAGLEGFGDTGPKVLGP